MRIKALLIITYLVACVSMLASDITKDITPAVANTMIAKGRYLILDVRTENEYRSGHLVNAVLVDFYKKDFLDNLRKLNKEQPVIVYCARGRRSAEVMDMMKKNGFKKVYNVLGGFERWSAESLPSAP